MENKIIFETMKLVTFETAKLAKENGFDIWTENMFYGDGEEFIAAHEVIKFENNDKSYFRPTQDQLQDWLETKNRYLSIAPEFYTTGINWNWQVLWYIPKEEWEYFVGVNESGESENIARNIIEGTGFYGDNGEYPTRHDAVEAALRMALMKLDPLYMHNSIEKLSKLYRTDINGMLSLIRPFSNEMGDWAFNNLTPDQLKIIITQLGIPESLI